MHGKDKTKYGKLRTGFGFQISIMVGSLHHCKVEKFGVILMGNWNRNSIWFSGAIEIQFSLAVWTEIQFGLVT